MAEAAALSAAGLADFDRGEVVLVDIISEALAADALAFMLGNELGGLGEAHWLLGDIDWGGHWGDVLGRRKCK